ncbi:MFS transporter [Alcanivorax marinus]|uniref:MFS transporter n=1 Tax=Alloalcanivorax marinus TaxID=1177169 RepID=A0A9Q3YLY3_9GAMM|nr:MFS transporter [Alloalcanivorax marinus]MCC4306961.1 MFS transporter [Alloalcanivorax marinus]
MKAGVSLGATGFALIAVCYGFARFAFGLFLPRINADLSLSSTLGGLIAGGSFLAYCVAIVLAAHLTERLGPRRVAVAAALVAGAGMTGIALAPSGLWLAPAVMLAGSSTGLSSPPLAAAVSRVVAPARQAVTNTVINAGTSAGVILSGPAALLAGADWRLAFGLFAATALVLALAVVFSVPGRPGKASASADPRSLYRRLPVRLVAAAFLAGAGSAALWSFGGELVALRLDWDTGDAGLLWIAIGVAGVVGAVAGRWGDRFGIDRVHRVFLVMQAAGIVLVGAGWTTPALTLAGGALFGAAYITLTGIYLVWGVRVLPDRPASGLMVGFLTVAIGQTAGAPVFGFLMDRFPALLPVTLFAGVTVLGLFARAGKDMPGAADADARGTGLAEPQPPR